MPRQLSRLAGCVPLESPANGRKDDAGSRRGGSGFPRRVPRSVMVDPKTATCGFLGVAIAGYPHDPLLVDG